jgi:hypothetical protein
MMNIKCVKAGKTYRFDPVEMDKRCRPKIRIQAEELVSVIKLPGHELITGGICCHVVNKTKVVALVCVNSLQDV